MQTATKPATAAPGVKVRKLPWGWRWPQLLLWANTHVPFSSQKTATTKLTKKQTMKQKMQALRERKQEVQAQRCAEKLAAAAAANPTSPGPRPSQVLETVDPSVPEGNGTPPPPPDCAAAAPAGAADAQA